MEVMSKRNIRQTGIDALRGIAALAVTFFHLTGSTGLSEKIKNSGKYGYLGVEAFFVISGFIIPYSMERTGYTYQKLSEFLKRRYARLFPPYFMAIIITLLLTFLAQGSCNQWLSAKVLLLHVGFLVDIFSMKWMNPVFWSLAIEMQFYIFIAFLLPLLLKENKIMNISIILFTSLLPCLSFKAAYLPYWMSLFNLGLFAYLQIKRALSTAVLIAFLFINVLICALKIGTAEATVGMVAYFFIILSFKIDMEHIYRPLVKLGTISYSLYLVHWELGRAGVSFARHAPYLGQNEYFRLIMGLCVAILSAFIAYFFVEKKAIKLSRII
jgi:peptidoglycan/LPS O-acetylase OafA/YrhL